VLKDEDMAHVFHNRKHSINEQCFQVYWSKWCSFNWCWV